MLDIQHIPNKKDVKRLVKGYEINKGVAISLPSREHRLIKYADFSYVQDPRLLLSLEIKRLRKYTAIPSSVLIKIIEANKSKYKEFNKIKK